MADGNPFAPPQVDIAGGVQGLMHQFQQQRAYAKQQQLETARKTALSQLLSGNVQDPMKMIMGYGQQTGDIAGMGVLANAIKATRPPEMSPWQNADLAFRYKQAGDVKSEREFANRMKGVDKDTAGFWYANPGAAPPWFQEHQGSMSGTSSPGNTEPQRLGPSDNNAPPQTRDEYIQRQIYAKKQAEMMGKRPLVQDAKAHLDAINAGYSDALKTVDEMINTPDSAKTLVLGGMAFMPGLDSNTSNFLANLETLKSQIGLSKFQDLRETSKTGASGFNRLTNFELQQLQQSIASLDRSQTTDQFNKHLADVKGRLLSAKIRMEHQFAKEYGSELQMARGNAPQPNPAPGSGVTIAPQPQAGAPGETMMTPGIVDFREFFK